MLTLCTANLWGAEAKYVFNAKDLTGTTLNGSANNSWSISEGSIGSYDASRGIQTTAATLTITSTDQYSNITKVELDYSTNDKSTAKISVKVGSTTSAEQQVEKSKTNLTLAFNFSDMGDNKTVAVTMKRNGSAGSLYVKKVTITYGSSGTSTSHTVTWSSNGDDSNTENYLEGASINFPTTADGCDDKTFIGWSATTVAITDTKPSLVSEATMGTSDITYYAVFADADGEGVAALTKMVKGDTFTNGDKIVIVANGTTVALYQETKNTSYVQKWTFDNKVATVAADDKRWITVSTATGGWYLGDATNGYLNTGSNNTLYCDDDQSIWTLGDNDDGTFRLYTTYYLSYRTDLSGDNKTWRGGGTKGTSGVSTLDIYKYTEGSTSYSGYTTSCTVPTEVTVTYDANGGLGTMTAQTISYNTATTLQANTFTREGYTFQGWATSASGTKVYDDKASVTLKKNTTLYAVWSKNSYSITLNDLDHGELTTSPASTAEYGATVTITVTPNSGYQFGSITVTNDKTGTTIPTDGTGSTQTFTMPASNVTVTATVTVIPTYTVTWSKNGDETDKDSYIEGAMIAFPTTADGCDGKTFMGWSADPVAEQEDAPTYTTSATMPAHNVTYYAVYAEASGGGGIATWDEAAIASLTSADVFVIVGNGSYALPNDAEGTPSVSNVTISAGKITSAVEDKLKWNISGNAASGYTFYPNGNTEKWLYSNTTANSSSNTNIRIGTGDRNIWDFDDNDQLVTKDDYTARYLAVQGNADWRGYVNATTSTTTIKFYKQSGGTTYTGYTTTCGAGISAKNIGWMTTAQGQKVKRIIPVSAKNFDDATTLIATCANPNFSVSLGETAVPAGTSGLTTTLTVEYLPTASNTTEADVDIVLTAGDKTRTITVSGRSVPDEFLLITKKASTWYALPANMGSAGEHDGVEVYPNDATTPTTVPVSPSTIIYTLSSVANSRYAENGHLVRLVGNENRCLWSSTASGDSKVNIRNYAALGETNGNYYEWDLRTTDGVHYYIENPANAEYADGRRLAYGTKFGMYKEETVFFIVKAGCSSQPGDVLVSPRRVDATFSWVSNTPSMYIDLYTDSEMTTGHLSATASSSPYVFSGLEETTDYWYKLTPGDDTDCAVTGSFKTTGPIIDIVEWQENGVVLFIDKGDINPLIIIDGQEEHGSITGGGNATELFFAKYFEGAGEMKLLSIFNGTQNDIDFTGSHEYVILQRSAGSSATVYSSNITISGTTYDISTLGPNDKRIDLNSLGKIRAGQEIIFFTRPQNICNEQKLYECSNTYLDEMASKNKVTDNPRWIELSSTNTINGMNFNGNDALILLKDNVAIDVFGAALNPAEAQNHKNCRNEVGWIGTIKNMDYGKTATDFPSLDLGTYTLDDYSIDVTNENIDIHSARCILFRNKDVTSGTDAVANNTSNFNTLTAGEWVGRSVCKSSTDCDNLGWTYSCGGNTYKDNSAATCNSYQDLAAFDYNQYYIDWNNIDPGQELSTFSSNPETKEYTIPITDMRQYACLNLRFQLKLGDDVLTEAAQQVPIVVTGDIDTNDPLFSELVIDKGTGYPSYSHSLARCKDCDVVVLGSASLTKGDDSDSKDVPEVGNVKVYPGGKLIVPSGTNYTIKSLALRRQEDEVARADIQGTLNYSTSVPEKTYLDVRIDPTNWHYFALPYDVKVSDIRYANEDETAVPVLGTDYLLQWYDGEYRAAHRTGGWTDVQASETLRKGLGYIIALPGSGKVKRELRFPMANDVITEETADKTVTGVKGYGGDKTNEELRPNHKGWNLLGNPYMTDYKSDISTPLRTGLLIEDHSTEPWDGKWTENNDGLRYIVEPIDYGWSGYRQVPMANYAMKPFTCYFVQIGTEGSVIPTDEQSVLFNISQTVRASAPRRFADEETDTHPVWFGLTITAPNAETDNTALLISDKFTDGYDMMNDLVKMRGSYYQYYNKPVIASRNNEGEMAFNALPDTSAELGVPLNYYAATAGTHTIAIDPNYDTKEIQSALLYDATTAQYYDLMSEPHEFTTAKGDNTNRFKLFVRVERKKADVSTEFENIAIDSDTPKKLLINGHVFIQRGGAIYDVTGKEVFNLK